VKKYKSVTCDDEDQAEKGTHEARKLVYYQGDNGSWVIHARLPAEAGSLVIKAIEAVATSRQKAGSEEDVSAETSSAAMPAEQNDSTEQALDLEQRQIVFESSFLRVWWLAVGTHRNIHVSALPVL